MGWKSEAIYTYGGITVPPASSPAPTHTMSQQQLVAELKDIQTSLFDRATNYTKLVLGLGYAGFFTAWAGTRAQLRPIEVVASAFLMCLSLLSYVAFELVQGWFLNKAAIDLARTISQPGLEMSALNEYRARVAKAQAPVLKIWSWVFCFSAGTGLLGAFILISAFVRALWRIL